MTDSFIEPESLNADIFTVQAFSDEDGGNRIINSDIMSVDFDGVIPVSFDTKAVSELGAGMSFIIPGTDDPVTVISVYSDDPEIVDDPSDDYIVSYLSDSGNIESLILDPIDEIEVFYENTDDIALGQTGWAITQGGNAIFNKIIARGKIEALSGDIGGWEIEPQGELEDGKLKYNASVPAGESGSGSYLTGIYTGFGIHTDDWEIETEIHQPSKIFMIYGPGLDPDGEGNLEPQWADPKTTFYADGHGYFSLGDKLTFDANEGVLEISGYATEDDLEDLDYLTEDDIFITGTTDISGNRIRTGILEGLVYRSNASINRTSGNGVYFDDGGYLRVARGSSVLSFNGDTGALNIEGYATDNELSGGLSGKINNGGAATDVNSNFTNISGGRIRTGQIESTGYSGGNLNGTAFSSVGMRINLDNGSISSPNFRIDNLGNAAFAGTLSSGVSISAPVISGGSITGTTVTGSLFRTALSGKRVEIQTSGFNNGEILFYNDSGVARGRIAGSSNVLTIDASGGVEVVGPLNLFGFSNLLRNNGPSQFGLTPGVQAGLRISGLGEVFSYGIATNTLTTGDFNIRIQPNPPHQMLRITSSVRYKGDLCPLDDNLMGVEENKISKNPSSLDPYDVLLITPTEFKGLTQADEGHRALGFIAEDVAIKFPWAAEWEEDGTPAAVQSTPILAAMLSVVKDQQKLIEDLQNRVLQLESQLGG